MYGPLCENIMSSTKPEVHNYCIVITASLQQNWLGFPYRKTMCRCHSNHRTHRQTVMRLTLYAFHYGRKQHNNNNHHHRFTAITEDFVGAKFYCPHAVADDWEKTLELSSITLYTLSLYLRCKRHNNNAIDCGEALSTRSNQCSAPVQWGLSCSRSWWQERGRATSTSDCGTREPAAGTQSLRCSECACPCYSAATIDLNVSTWLQCPSVLWHCRFGGRESIWSVKIKWWGVGVVICLEQGADCLYTVQLMPLPSQNVSCLI